MRNQMSILKSQKQLMGAAAVGIVVPAEGIGNLGRKKLDFVGMIGEKPAQHQGMGGGHGKYFFCLRHKFF